LIDVRQVSSTNRNSLFLRGDHQVARQDSKILDGGDAFPALEMDIVGGGKMNVPGDMGDGWKAVLLIRGYF
jgi:hypothetical protein